jgi:hypothetical protein
MPPPKVAELPLSVLLRMSSVAVPTRRPSLEIPPPEAAELRLTVLLRTVSVALPL